MLISRGIGLSPIRAAVLGLAGLALLQGCSKRADEDEKPGDAFSSNPIKKQLLNKSRETVLRETRRSGSDLDKSHYPKYVETKGPICIIWFPMPFDSSDVVLDDRLTYVTCLDGKASLSDPMEFHSYQDD